MVFFDKMLNCNFTKKIYYIYIKKITDNYQPVFTDHIIGSVQKNLNKSWRK